MITAGDFKKGITVEWDGGVWNIVDFQHVKPGKGAAFVRTKIKNVMTGAVVERTFNPTDKMPRAIIETKEMQYLYKTAICTTSWTTRPTSRCLWARTPWKTPSFS
jgi:Translation elongation factor P (EF-P)/translation initiation factor 5A (eIF-5A)